MQAKVLVRPSHPGVPQPVPGLRALAVEQAGRQAVVLVVSLNRDGVLVGVDPLAGPAPDLALAPQTSARSAAAVVVVVPDRRRARLVAELVRVLRWTALTRALAVSCADPLVLEELRSFAPRVRLLLQVPVSPDVERHVRRAGADHGVHLTLEQAVACAGPLRRLAGRSDLTVAVEASGARDVAHARCLGADLVLPPVGLLTPGPVDRSVH